MSQRGTCAECKKRRRVWSDGENDPICKTCHYANFISGAVAAGIPREVAEGRAKLRDYFSQEYIDDQCSPRLKHGERRADAAYDDWKDNQTED